MCKQKEQSHGIAHTQRYILNSFIKTGFCWGTACHDRADDANARFPRAREGLLVAVRRACMVQGQVVDGRPVSDPRSADEIISQSQRT